MAYIYRHIRLDKNCVFYIGIGSDKNYKRAHNKINRTKFWKNVAKHGYEVDIVLDNLTWEEACEKEKEFIALYGRLDLNNGTLVNMTDGGEGVMGRKFTEATIEKFRHLARNLVRDEEFKRKCGSSMRGKKHSEETKLKMSASQKGRVGPMKGKKHSELARKKISQNNPMLNQEVVEKWKQSIKNRTDEQRLNTKEKIKEAAFNRYSEEALKERYKALGDKMRGVKRPHTSNTMKGKKKEQTCCPNCGIYMSKNHMTRYHTSKCIKKEE